MEIKMKKYSQVCVIYTDESIPIAESTIKEWKHFLKRTGKELRVRFKFIGFFESNNSESIDLFFYVHSDDIDILSEKKFDYHIRWFEDVVLNYDDCYTMEVIEKYYHWPLDN